MDIIFTYAGVFSNLLIFIAALIVIFSIRVAMTLKSENGLALFIVVGFVAVIVITVAGEVGLSQHVQKERKQIKAERLPGFLAPILERVSNLSSGFILKL